MSKQYAITIGELAHGFEERCSRKLGIKNSVVCSQDEITAIATEASNMRDILSKISSRTRTVCQTVRRTSGATSWLELRSDGDLTDSPTRTITAIISTSLGKIVHLILITC